MLVVCSFSNVLRTILCTKICWLFLFLKRILDFLTKRRKKKQSTDRYRENVENNKRIFLTKRMSFFTYLLYFYGSPFEYNFKKRRSTFYVLSMYIYNNVIERGKSYMNENLIKLIALLSNAFYFYLFFLA